VNDKPLNFYSKAGLFCDGTRRHGVPATLF